MNILLTDATDIFAGGEDYVLTLARALVRRRHRVWVSARPDHLLLRKCAETSIPTVPLPYGPMGRVFAVAHDLRRALRVREIDIVHSNANYDRTCAALASARLPVCHIAGVHSTHSIQHNVTHWLRNRYGTDHFITDADAGKDVLVRKDGIPMSQVTTVPIGIEGDDVKARKRIRTRTRAALGIAPRTVVIGNVARLVPFKGHRYLLDAAAIAARRARNFMVIIVGDGELERELRDQARSLGIEANVRFLGFRDNLHELYPSFDLYCHSSVDLASEMFPIAILRALAAGLPVVATRVGGIDAMVEEKRTGFLTSPADPGALAAGLMDLLRNPAKRARMGSAGYRLFLRKYHADEMAERVEEVYRYTLSQGPGAR